MPFTFARYLQLSGGRRIEWIALIATIPAFYMAMLSVDRPIMMLLYGLACIASSAVIWIEVRRAWRQASRGSLYARHQLWVCFWPARCCCRPSCRPAMPWTCWACASPPRCWCCCAWANRCSLDSGAADCPKC